jgi:hypothetical protein
VDKKGRAWTRKECGGIERKGTAKEKSALDRKEVD